MDMKDRYRDSLVALAVGNALSTTVEWTDDTSMALSHPNAIYTICMQQPELARVVQFWGVLSDEEQACILAIVDENRIQS